MAQVDIALEMMRTERRCSLCADAECPAEEYPCRVCKSPGAPSLWVPAEGVRGRVLAAIFPGGIMSRWGARRGKVGLRSARRRAIRWSWRALAAALSGDYDAAWCHADMARQWAARAAMRRG